jgi:hypothetical protein
VGTARVLIRASAIVLLDQMFNAGLIHKPWLPGSVVLPWSSHLPLSALVSMDALVKKYRADLSQPLVRPRDRILTPFLNPTLVQIL